MSFQNFRENRKKLEESLSDEHKDALSSIRLRKIFLPILIGLAVVIYLFYNQFDKNEFAKIDWNSHTIFWIFIAMCFVVIRHLGYSWRLKILSDGEFSWLKCIQLIFIWEFSSAVSPSAVGGSAVAFFVLSQEKLSKGKSATIVLYTVILDSLFFLISVPILLLVFGSDIIRPDMSTWSQIDAWGYTFFGAYSFMMIYAAIIAYGIFISPLQIKRLMIFFTRIPFLRKFRHDAIEIGSEIIKTSGEVRNKPYSYHLGGFLGTAIAWSSRFILLNCLIIGIMGNLSLDFETQGTLFGRLLSMFIIIAFSPTPGGAGFVEFLFGGFLNDYVSSGISIVIASIWRIMTYYSYLIAGVIIIPQWISGILRKRRKKKRANLPR